MASCRQILYHLTFHTKNSQKVLQNPGNEELFKYIWGIVKNNNCKLYRINGIEDHIHVVCDLHQACQFPVDQVKRQDFEICDEPATAP